MAPEPEVEAGNRFGSWYKNDSWADITVCFKVRSTSRSFVDNSVPDSSTGMSCRLPGLATNNTETYSPDLPPAAFLTGNGNSCALMASRGGTPLPSSQSSDCSQEDDASRRKRARTEAGVAPQHDSIAASTMELGVCEIVDEFPAHRLVLGSMSDVFKVQFTNWDRQLGARVSVMLDSREELEAAHELMRFMYFEQLSGPLDALTLIKVARLADQYQVLACLRACSNALCGLLNGISPVATSSTVTSSKSTASSINSDPNAELLLAAIMLEEHTGTALPQLQHKAVESLRGWFRDFDTAWNRDVLRSLFLQLPRSYLQRLLHPCAPIVVASENSIATALHYWAQAQPAPSVTPDVSTLLLRLLHFLGLTSSYLSVVLPTLPTFTASPEFMRYIGEACRLKMAEAYRKGQEAAERSGRDSRDRRDSREAKETLQLKTEDWQHIVARSLGLPTHFARKRTGSGSATPKTPWQYTWTVPCSQLQALYASSQASSSTTAGMGLKRRCLELCSPPRWYQGLMFTTKLQLVPPSEKRSSTNNNNNNNSSSSGGPDGNTVASGGSGRHSQQNADRAGDRGADRAGEAGGSGNHREPAGDSGQNARSASPAASAVPNPKIQVAVCVQIDPRLSESQSCAGVQFHMSYSFRVNLSQTGGEKVELGKTHTGALMPLDGSALWKPLWRISPAAIFDPGRAEGEFTVTTSVLEVN